MSCVATSAAGPIVDSFFSYSSKGKFTFFFGVFTTRFLKLGVSGRSGVSAKYACGCCALGGVSIVCVSGTSFEFGSCSIVDFVSFDWIWSSCKSFSSARGSSEGGSSRGSVF